MKPGFADHPPKRSPDNLVLEPAHREAVSILAAYPDLSAVVCGETGTGKEELARLVHAERCQREGRDLPFIPVNCAALNTELAESLLFGHKKGAFSGADRPTEGFVRAAAGGILFLDEVHCLAISAQQKLLRFLHGGHYTPLGGVREERALTQVVAATTCDLDDKVAAGTFLIDLRSRLTGIEIVLKPLRDRLDELPALLRIGLAGEEIAAEAFAELVTVCRGFYWQGNIRQLFKALRLMVVYARWRGEPVSAKHLPEWAAMRAPRLEPQRAATDLGVLAATGLAEKWPLGVIMDALEREVLKTALARHRKLRDVYRALGIGRNTLDAKRKRHGL